MPPIASTCRRCPAAAPRARSNRYIAVRCDAVARCAHIAACGGCHEAAGCIPPATAPLVVALWQGRPAGLLHRLARVVPAYVGDAHARVDQHRLLVALVAQQLHASTRRNHAPCAIHPCKPAVLVTRHPGCIVQREMQPSTPSKRQTHTTATQVASASHGVRRTWTRPFSNASASDGTKSGSDSDEYLKA